MFGPSRHNPRNNTFTSIYEAPININAKKQSAASSEVRWWRTSWYIYTMTELIIEVDACSQTELKHSWIISSNQILTFGVNVLWPGSAEL